MALNCFGGTQSQSSRFEQCTYMLIFGLAAINILKTCYNLYQTNCSVHIDTSKKALKMLSIITINIFIDCYTRFYYFFNTRTHYMSESEYLTVGRRSRDLRPLSRDRSVTFFKIFPNYLKHLKTLLDSRPTVA